MQTALIYFIGPDDDYHRENSWGVFLSEVTTNLAKASWQAMQIQRIAPSVLLIPMSSGSGGLACLIYAALERKISYRMTLLDSPVEWNTVATTDKK